MCAIVRCSYDIFYTAKRHAVVFKYEFLFVRTLDFHTHYLEGATFYDLRSCGFDEQVFIPGTCKNSRASTAMD